jgi:serine/threonine protein kinase
MTPERWKRLSGIFAHAVDLPPADRAAYLDRACEGPEELREVQELIRRHESSPDFLKDNGGALVAPLRPPPAEDVSLVGRRIGIYQFTAELGRGGMGVVYLATDTRLNRQVAIKVLPAALAGDEERRERMRREARAAAALKHPGIATVYALEEVGDDLFIVSEYIVGKSLRQAVAEALPGLQRVLAISTGIAEALAAAHAAGIVHRDLKPANVMLPDAGGVKLIDFGLARFVNRDDLETRTHVTQSGILVGTPAYMPPEQIRRGQIDERTDVFGLGVLIFEIASGVQPFADDTPGATMANVLERELDVSVLNTRGMSPLSSIVQKATAKEPAARYASAREMAAALEAVKAILTPPPPVMPPSPVVEPVIPPPPVLTSWRVHQAVVSVICLLMLWPLAAARRFDPRMDWAFFTAVAAAVFVLVLRLNFLASSYLDRTMLDEQRRRWNAVRQAADLAFSVVLLVAFGLVVDAHLAFAALFLAASLGLAAAAWMIEPATERTAFPTRRA